MQWKNPNKWVSEKKYLNKGKKSNKNIVDVFHKKREKYKPRGKHEEHLSQVVKSLFGSHLDRTNGPGGPNKPVVFAFMLSTDGLTG